MYSKVQDRSKDDVVPEAKTFDAQMAYYQAYGKGMYSQLRTLDETGGNFQGPKDNSLTQSSERSLLVKSAELTSNSSTRLRGNEDGRVRPRSIGELDVTDLWKNVPSKVDQESRRVAAVRQSFQKLHSSPALASQEAMARTSKKSRPALK